MGRFTIASLCLITLSLASGCQDRSRGNAGNSFSDYIGAPGLSSTTFDRLRRDVLAPRCAGCHADKATGAAGFSVASFADVLGSGYVVPGSSSRSHLCALVRSGHPVEAPLTAAAANEICNWIDGGLADDGVRSQRLVTDGE